MADPETERSELLKLLQIAEDRRWHHHTALWEEEKHFTWLIALIFPALVYVQANRELTSTSRLFLTLAGAAFGVFVSMIAIRVFRREGESFVDTMQMLNRIVHMLALDKDPTYQCVPSDRRMPISRSYKTTMLERNKPIRVLCFWPIRWLVSRVIPRREKPQELGVRDCFQVLFLGAIFLFVCFALWGVLIWSGL